MMKQKKRLPKKVTLKNLLTNEIVNGNMITEETIDGKQFFVIERNGIVTKLNKHAFIVMNGHSE